MRDTLAFDSLFFFAGNRVSGIFAERRIPAEVQYKKSIDRLNAARSLGMSREDRPLAERARRRKGKKRARLDGSLLASPGVRFRVAFRHTYASVRARMHARGRGFSLFGRVRGVSKGSARGRGSNWSRLRSKPNFSTRARVPLPVPVSGSQCGASRGDPDRGRPHSSGASPLYTCKNIYNRSTIAILFQGIRGKGNGLRRARAGEGAGRGQN